MSTPRTIGEFAGDLLTSRARNHRTVRDGHTREVAFVANAALLDAPSGRFYVGDLEPGEFSVSYVPSAEGAYLWIRAALAPAEGDGWATLSLTVRDAAGHSVGPTDARIPGGFQGETHSARTRFSADLYGEESVTEGYLDLAALAVDLVDPSWSLDLTMTGSAGALLTRWEGWAVPRFKLDATTPAGGVIPGEFVMGAPVTDSPTKGLVRVLSTIEHARAVQQTLVSLAWPKGTGAATPSTSATTLGPISGLDMGPDPIPFVVLPRRILAPSSTGEAHRWRVLYRMTGGAGTETATARVTATSDVPSAVSASLVLPYAAGWVWSEWKEGSTPTDGSDETVALTLEAKVSAAGPVLYVAGWVVLEAVP